MDHFRYFHLCNHTFQKTNDDSQVHNVIITNDGTNIDQLIERARILDIIEVRVLEYEPYPTVAEMEYENPNKEQTYEDVDMEDGWYDDDPPFVVDYSLYFDENGAPLPLPAEFYQSYLHNRIKWLVKPPIKYTVKVNVLFLGERTYKVDLEDCERCQGKGWFIDILNQYGKFDEGEPIVKIAQRVIKDLLTTVGSNFLDLSYGTIVVKHLAENSFDDVMLFNSIRLTVSEVEDRYLSRQAAEMDGLADDEVLIRLRCVDVFRSPLNDKSVIIELSIETRIETRNIRLALL